MPKELPSEVTFFLKLAGIQYPNIDEDQVRALAQHVRTFAENIVTTHAAAADAVQKFGLIYSWPQHEQWAAVTARATELNRACAVIATALVHSADVIEAAKGATTAELRVLAASCANVSATPGADVFWFVLREIAGKLCNDVEQVLASYIENEILSKALEHLEDVVDRFLAENADGICEIDDPIVDLTSSSSHDVAADLLDLSDILESHANAILKYAARFSEDVAKLDFTGTD